MSMLPKWSHVRGVDFSSTQVTGRITRSWEGCCKSLKTFRLSFSNVSFVPPERAYGGENNFLPNLEILELNHCPLHRELIDLLVPLRNSRIAVLQAAASGLKGSLPDFQSFTRPRLKHTLVAMELASNDISSIDAIPPNCRALNLANNHGKLSLNNGVLRQALKDGVRIDVRNMTLANQSEPKELLDENVIQKTRQKTMVNQEAGFECYDIATVSLQVSAHLFAPEDLCSCSPGWNGSGVSCAKCPQNFFKEEGSTDCQPCPEGSTSPSASTLQDACRCNIGELYDKAGTWTCGCPKDYALLDEGCVKCGKLHLNCSKPGSEVHSALPLPGFTRLEFGNETQAFQCLPPKMRCNAIATTNQSENSECSDGYAGLMCMECSHNYYATGERCEKCQDSVDDHNTEVILVILVVLAAIGFFLWRRQVPREQLEVEVLSSWNVLKDQIRAQAPILLQTCQLWVVLASLATEAKDNSHSDSENSFWEVPYLEAVQLSVAKLKGALNLQCRYDGATVCFTSAVMAPLFPLVVFACCALLEIFKPTSGITAGLQAITLLYIGGASSCSYLLSCQQTDGAGEKLPTSFEFRKSMPYISCHETSPLKTSVDVVGFSSAFCYAVVIPCCLLYLYARQHIILGSSRTIVATCHVADQSNLKVYLHEVRKSSNGSVSKMFATKLDGPDFARHLVAAAAAYISVLLRGRVRLQLNDGTMLVTLLEDSRSPSLEDDNVLSFLGDSTLMQAKQQAITLRCRTITDMLLERCVLEVAQDRILFGAKHLLLKYTLCRNLWMEILQKLVAVALVSIVDSKDALQLSLAITLGMAATCGLVQPYLQPQVNTLQSCCFVSLALAALSFGCHWVWLSRTALALPMLLSLAQVVQPDSAESLAVRLWQDLEKKLDALQNGEIVEVTSETYSFL